MDFYCIVIKYSTSMKDLNKSMFSACKKPNIAYKHTNASDRNMSHF